MIIQQVMRIRTNDLAQYAWSRLMRFQNAAGTAQAIIRRHGLPTAQHKNALSQAEEIKYCLSQAKEYYEAASLVSLATKPVLLYYSAMSMALAEVLFKQTADSRLSRLREGHNCHGLQLSVLGKLAPSDSLEDAAKKLVVKQQVDSTGKPKGTFEVWRRSAREYPIGGLFTHSFIAGGQHQSYRAIGVGSDIASPQLPGPGITFLECIQQLPYMGELLYRFGSSTDMVRATLLASSAENSNNITHTTIIHPNVPVLIQRFMDLIELPADAVNNIDVVQSGGSLIIRQNFSSLTEAGGRWPYSTCMSDQEAFFSCSPYKFNEFGFLYLGIHAIGNFARYYPDIWLKHIATSSPLALAIEELCTYALERLPLLMLSELDQTYYVRQQ